MQVALKQAAAGAAPKLDGTPMSIEEEVEHENDRDRRSVRKCVDTIARTDYGIAVEK